MIATLLIFALITIGCASAADDIQTDDSVAIEETITEKIMTDEVQNPGTFTDLTNEINQTTADVLELNRDYKFDSSQDSRGILVSHNAFTIDGKGHTIDGNKESYIFNNRGLNLTLKNLIIKNALGDTFNKTIMSRHGIGSLINCTFMDNIGYNGGFSLDLATVKYCRFINNNEHGLSMLFMQSQAIIENCTFINNTAATILSYYKGNASNCIFINNTLTDPENGILGHTLETTIRNCIFVGDNCESITQSFRTRPSKTNIINCTFNHTDAKTKSTFNIIKNAEIINSTFINTIIEIERGSNNNPTSIEISNSRFENTSIKNIGENLTLSKNTFENGYVDNQGTMLSPVYLEVPSYVQNSTGAFLITRLVDDNGNSIYNNFSDGDFFNFVLNGEELSGETYGEINGQWFYQLPVNSVTGNYAVSIKLANQEEFKKHYGQTSGLNIFKMNSEVIASSASYVINYGGKYSITLKDSEGNVRAGEKVVFTLNGKTIGSAVTGANGVATITLTASTLKTAKAGSKNLVITYNGDDYYNSVSKTVKVTIKKEAIKIVAKKKTFKRATKTKKYTITLKNSKGKVIKKAKVTLKVKGKTYKATTNSKGKATFKIKKLTKKGKYVAKIAYKTTANYLKASKKIKITVK